MAAGAAAMAPAWLQVGLRRALLRGLRGFAETIFEHCTGVVIKFVQQSTVLAVESTSAAFSSIQGKSVLEVLSGGEIAVL